MHEHFEILGIKKDASHDEAKQAYRDLLKVWHPDRFSSDEPRLKELAEKNTRKILLAYEIVDKYLQSAASSVHQEIKQESHISSGVASGVRRRARRTIREGFKDRTQRISQSFVRDCRQSICSLKQSIGSMSWYHAIGHILWSVTKLCVRSIYSIMLLLAAGRILIPCTVVVLYLIVRSGSSVGAAPPPVARFIDKVNYSFYHLSKAIGALRHALR